MKASLRSSLVLGLWLSAIAGGLDAAQAHTPYSNSEIQSIESSDESRIRELRAQEIRQLRIALGRRLPTNRQADLYYRLAEIYLEGYHQEYLLEGRAHDKRLEKGQADPLIDHSRSRPYLTLGIQASQEIIRLGISFSRLDQIYYFLAFNYCELGERKQGLKYYELITQRFPSSPFAAEAYRELGDQAYDLANYRRAINFYELAAKSASEEALPRIDHKLAWAYYRNRQSERAIDTMKQAVSLSQKNGEKFLSIREEALRDMAVFMTEAGRVDEAIAYFQKSVKDPSFYPKILERLGKQYERNVEPAKATQVYESLLKTNPESEAAFRVLVKLVDLDLRRSRFKEALVRLSGLKLPKKGEEETLVAAQNLRAMVRRTATEHHEVFRKKADRQALEIAESYYAAYLTIFLEQDDSRKETQEIQMYLAEVKRELGKSKEASALYRKVVDSRDPRYAKEAGALWTASLSEAIRKAGEGSPGSVKANEPSETEKEYVEAADRLQVALGETAEGREAALRAAQVLAGYPETRKEAMKRIRKITENSPHTSQALTAARLWIQLQAENPKADDDDMRDLLKKLHENSALMAADQEQGKGKLKQAMNEQETRLKIVQIGRNEKDHQFAAAGSGYESFAQEAPQKDVAEKAYANAITTYLKVGDAVSIERVAGHWFKRYPRGTQAVDAVQAAATYFLISGKFEAAGALFEKCGNEGGDVDSFETAARIFEGTTDLKRSLNNRGQYLQKLKVSLNAPSTQGHTLIALARMHEVLGDDREATQAYRDCMGISPEFESECGVRLADLMLKLKNSEEAMSLLKKVAQISSRKKSETTAALLPAYVGFARFRLADSLEQAQAFEPLALPEEKLKRAMASRLTYMESISRAYNSVVEAGGPWAVAALDRLARAALSFANEVDQISPPEKLSPQGVEQFKRNLSQVSTPLRRKALETWAEAYRKAVVAEVLSPVIPAIADRLAQEGAKTPARAQGVHGRFRLAGLPSDGGSEGLEKSLQKVREKLAKNPSDAALWIDYGNLLWGSGKPVLSRLSYERALQLAPRNSAALNNRAVELLSGVDGPEDWRTAEEALVFFQKALKGDEFFTAAKINRALLLNYYRLFERARPLWEQVLVRNDFADAQEGLAIALQGQGNLSEAQAAFDKAGALGASKSGFVHDYHQAARLLSGAGSGLKSCPEALESLSSLKNEVLSGFEREAVERLRRLCASASKGEK